MPISIPVASRSFTSTIQPTKGMISTYKLASVVLSLLFNYSEIEFKSMSSSKYLFIVFTIINDESVSNNFLITITVMKAVKNYNFKHYFPKCYYHFVTRIFFLLSAAAKHYVHYKCGKK